MNASSALSTFASHNGDLTLHAFIHFRHCSFERCSRAQVHLTMSSGQTIAIPAMRWGKICTSSQMHWNLWAMSLRRLPWVGFGNFKAAESLSSCYTEARSSSTRLRSQSGFFNGLTISLCALKVTSWTAFSAIGLSNKTNRWCSQSQMATPFKRGTSTSSIQKLIPPRYLEECSYAIQNTSCVRLCGYKNMMTQKVKSLDYDTTKVPTDDVLPTASRSIWKINKRRVHAVHFHSWGVEQVLLFQGRMKPILTQYPGLLPLMQVT